MRARLKKSGPGRPRKKSPAKTRAAPASDAQKRLLAFLLHPNSYPHRTRRVRLVQTHSSFVFIAPPFVFKVKKPVNFGFLDFSTLEKRRHFCEREVELNRRLSPSVYLGVVPITVRNGRFTLGGEGKAVEYAVQMRQLSHRYFLDRRVRRDEVGPGDLDRIVLRLREFYEAQHPTEEVEAWGRIDRLRISTNENFRQARAFLGQTLSRPAFAAIRGYTEEFYRKHRPLLASRIRERWIRDCHGDLHLEHVHLTPRALNIYDCIEFNDRFRYVDVANDAAFLAMDLDYENRPDLGKYFASRMAAALHDEGMPRLMDFYKCYRACVRGKVESLHSIAPSAPEAERQASADHARRYFQWALRYAVSGSEPLVLVVMGRIASGKSTLARALASELGWRVYSSDAVRKEMAGVPLYKRSSAEARRRLYSKAMTRKTYNTLWASAKAEVKTGRSVILDATFGRREHRAALIRRLRARKIAFRFLEAQASDAVVKRRLAARAGASSEVSDARLEDFKMLTRLYSPPTEVPQAKRVIVRTGATLESTVTAALRALACLRQ